MQNLTVHLGSVTPLSSRAGPRVPALSSAPAGRPAPPVSDTAVRHCAAAHPSAPSLPALSGRHARARRTSPTSAALETLPDDVRRSGPSPTAPPRRVAPPRPGPPTFSLLFPSVALPPSRSLPAHAALLVPPSPLLSDSFSRVPELPHRSSHLDRRLRPPAAPYPSWIPAEHRRRPPLPGELLPELPIPEISSKSLTPSPLLSCRTSSPPSATTGAPSPPTNVVARRRLYRLTVDPPFRCAPALSSFSDTFSVNPRGLRQHLAAVELPLSRRRGRRHAVPRALQQAAQAGWPAGLGC
jgi:hypothetical protein